MCAGSVAILLEVDIQEVDTAGGDDDEVGAVAGVFLMKISQTDWMQCGDSRIKD